MEKNLIKNENNIPNENGGNNLNIRIQLFKETNPFIYIQNDLDSRRYRISTNYEYLNSKYNLKIQFIRDLNKLDKRIGSQNLIMDWLIHKEQQSIYFKDDIQLNVEELEFKFNSDSIWNIFKVFRYSYGDKEHNNRTSILIFNKKFGNDSGYSLFFASESFLNIEDFLYSQYKQKK